MYYSLVNYIVLDEGMDYANLNGFKNKEVLSCQTVSRDLKYTEQTDAITVVANHPSYVTTTELFVSKKSGKTILLARGPIPML